MAWLGESFANLKGQISNFTKEVLTEGREEDEEFAESDELHQSKKLIHNLEELCGAQKKEIERLQVQTIEFQEKSEVQERQSKSLAESYDTLLHCKEEENKRLREQIDNLLLKQQQQREQLEVFQNNEPGPRSESISIGTNTDEEVSQSKTSVCDGETSPEPVQAEEEILDDRLELEERCSSYQNDLFLLREELMTLQHAVDEKELENARLHEEVLEFLHADFILDAQPALRTKGKIQQHPFADPSRNVILSALRQLASIWKDLVDRKATLERTVAKLSVSQSHSPPSEKFDRSQELFCFDDGDELRKSSGTAGSNFFPLKVDQFGLETIIEDERGEDDNRLGEAELPPDDQPGNIAFIHKSKSSPSQVQVQRLRANVPLISSSSQTEAEEIDPNLLQVKEQQQQQQLMEQIQREQGEQQRLADKMVELELKWTEKEREWISQVEEREDRIKKLEAELERLRSHLVDLEEQATSDALVSEEQEKQLRIQLAQLQSQITQTLQDNDRIGDVKEELNRLTAERDVARAQNSSYEDQIQKLSLQLQNLHFVLVQFQKEKETDIGNIEKMLRAEINQLVVDKDLLKKEIQSKEDLLEKARSGLEAAQQLNAQIDEKTRSISVLKAQVQEKETEISKLNSQIKEVGSNLDGKVDRYLLKNLIVGYFSTPADKRKEVLRVIATVLDFNREDRQKTGLEGTSIWPFKLDSFTAEKQSLSEAFIKFLENESQPKVQVRIPSEEITRRNSRSSSSSTVPGESPIPRSNSPSVSAAASSSNSSSSSASLIGGVPEISMSLPVLNQADRSNSILKDVLNPKP